MARNLLHYIFNNDSFNHTLSPPAVGGLLFCLFFRTLEALLMTNDVTIFGTADEMFLTRPLIWIKFSRCTSGSFQVALYAKIIAI